MAARKLATVLAAAAGFGVGSAAAQEFPDNPLIVQGIALYEDLEYEQSIEVLQRALVRAENVPDQKVAIFKYLALNYLVLGRMEDARQAFRQLLAIQPDFALGMEFSPEHRAFLEEVRVQWEGEGRPGWRPPETRLPPVALQHDLPAQARPGQTLELTVRTEDPAGRTERVVVAYRTAGSGEFTRARALPRADGSLLATIPGDTIEPPVVEYYFEALDGSGTVVAQMGSASIPLRVPVPGEEEGGVLTAWWFWTAIGVGVAAAVAIPVAILMTGEDVGGGEPATVTIVLCDPSVGVCPP